ncbi:MAG: type II toxin-antitoxin system mRNA interferase toxin, RelE/StbE family [Spirochaetes bacterium]|nr:type II toxin-antitoxin system mRNA interferase toxin, RelE/StbE family [Spirochaetota bacterium]
MYSGEFHPRIKKDIKNLDKQVYFKVKDELVNLILENPHIGEDLLGVFKGIKSYHFKINRIDYRIAYMIFEERKSVYFTMIGTRENFYEELKRRIK